MNKTEAVQNLAIGGSVVQAKNIDMSECPFLEGIGAKPKEVKECPY